MKNKKKNLMLKLQNDHKRDYSLIYLYDQPGHSAYNITEHKLSQAILSW